MAKVTEEEKNALHSEDLSVDATTAKIPDFNFKSPTVWLRQVNGQFKIAKITSEETQYYYILGRLPESVATECEDVIPENYVTGTLATLKQALINRYSLSSEQRIKEVLDNMQYTPPELPSVFFRRLLSTANNVLPYDIVLQRFRNRLPNSISIAITPMTNNLSNIFKITGVRPSDEEKTMLEVADAIQPQSSVATVNSGNVPSFRRKNHNQQRPRSASRGRSSSTRRFREDGAWCQNHFKFRDDARKCGRPGSCTFRPRSQSKN